MNSSSSSLKLQHPRLAIDQRQKDDRKRVLQRRELIELVEHDLGIGVPLQLEDQPHRLLQIAFVAPREMPLIRSSLISSPIRFSTRVARLADTASR